MPASFVASSLCHTILSTLPDPHPVSACGEARLLHNYFQAGPDGQPPREESSLGERPTHSRKASQLARHEFGQDRTKNPRFLSQSQVIPIIRNTFTCKQLQAFGSERDSNLTRHKKEWSGRLMWWALPLSTEHIIVPLVHWRIYMYMAWQNNVWLPTTAFVTLFCVS